MHCLGDGAFWIQEQVERVFGTKGSYLVDFFHLSEYLSGAEEKCSADATRKWLHERQEEMKTGQFEKVIDMLKTYEEQTDTKEENGPVRKCLRYIENRPGQFKYKEALAAELPIGSGEIESANRSVVQKRLKIAGACWKPETAELYLLCDV
jgi:predicted dehydrogenase